MKQNPHRFRIGAVSYLNTVPLVWGMLHGDERDRVDLSFSIPSECAKQIEGESIDVGLVPVAEIARQKLETISSTGIACFGAVRSILLFSRVPWQKVRTLAADASSRTSVQLARVILTERFGTTPQITEHDPVLDTMLATADAALLIGDPALRLDPQRLPYDWLDLGEEWKKLTGLPMVFATWAGRNPDPALAAILDSSFQFGEKRMDEIVEREHRKRGISRQLAKEYLRKHIRFTLGEREMEGLREFVQLAGLGEATDAYATTNN